MVLNGPCLALDTKSSDMRSAHCFAIFNVSENLLSGVFKIFGALTSHDLQINLFLIRIIAEGKESIGQKLYISLFE